MRLNKFSDKYLLCKLSYSRIVRIIRDKIRLNKIRKINISKLYFELLVALV